MTTTTTTTNREDRMAQQRNHRPEVPAAQESQEVRVNTRKSIKTIVRRFVTAGLAATLAVGVTQVPVAEASNSGPSGSGLNVRNYDSHVDVRGLYFVLRAQVTDDAGNPVAGAPVVFEELDLSGNGNHRLLCIGNSDASGWAECRNREPSLAPVLDHTWTMSYVMGNYDVWSTARGWLGITY